MGWLDDLPDDAWDHPSVRQAQRQARREDAQTGMAVILVLLFVAVIAVALFLAFGDGVIENVTASEGWPQVTTSEGTRPLFRPVCRKTGQPYISLGGMVDCWRASSLKDPIHTPEQLAAAGTDPDDAIRGIDALLVSMCCPLIMVLIIILGLYLLFR